jgi:hypothetical protein
MRLMSQGAMRRGTTWLAAKRPTNRLPSCARRRAQFPLVLAGRVSPRGGLARPCLRSTSRRLQGDARTTSLGEPDRDRLLGRPRAVLAFADVMNFLSDELAGGG